MVQFNEIPGNLRVPLFYAEFNGAQTPYQSISRLLLVGQKLTGGTATANVPIQVSQYEDGLFGLGSMLAGMYKIARRNAPFQEIWCLPLADAGSSTAATGIIDVTAAPTFSGELTVYIAGRRVRVAVSTADTAATVAAALTAAINAFGDMPVTAVQGTSTNNHKVNLTAVHAGTLGNFITLITDYFGDEGLLASLMLTITAMASGAGDPSMATGLAACGSDEFDFIAAPYTDATNLGVINAFLNGSSGRWSPIQQLYGHYFSAKMATQSTLSTFGNTLNDPNVSVMGYYNSPSAPWEWAAAFAALAAAHLQDAPELSRPLQTLWMQGILPPKSIGDRFSIQQRQALYYDGISSYHVLRGDVKIDRAITTYQVNAWGSPDASWLNVETRFQSIYAIRYLKAKVTGIWGRASLRSDNPFGIQGVATPDSIRDTIVHGYRELSALNVVENQTLFESALIVERNNVDADRVDVFLPLDMVNQLRVIGVNATVFAQFPDNVNAIQGR